MQTLWSRAIQSQCMCKCVSCISKTSGIALRVSPDSVKASWGFSGPTSTFLYSTFFAPAAVADGHSKRQRTTQWDNAISMARQALETPQKDLHGDGKQLTHEVDTNGPGAISKAYQVPTTQEQPEDLWDFVEYDSRRPETPRPPWPNNTGPDLNQLYLPPQSLWSHDGRRQTALRRRFFWKKLARQELAVARLICRLLFKCEAFKAPKEILDALPPKIRDIALSGKSQMNKVYENIKSQLEWTSRASNDSSLHIIQQAQYIRRKNVAVPEYHEDDYGEFLDVTRQLNSSLRALLHKNRNPSPDERLECVGKICHNLLISSAPPDVQTFNLLLLGFSRWFGLDLCKSVIRALDDAKIRPNELTCAAVLEHYVDSDDPIHFTKYIARMRGTINPLMLARPDVRIEGEAQARLIRRTDGKVKQKVYPTPLVGRALMRGVMKFACFDRAMEIYHEMKSDGWGLDVQTVSRLLQDCAIKGSWIDGYLLWEEFQHLRSKGSVDKYLSKFYACMLGLCETTGKMVAYNEVLGEAVRAGLDRWRLARSAHALALRVFAIRAAQSNKGDSFRDRNVNVGDSVFIALSDWADDIKKCDRDAKDEYELDFDSEDAKRWDRGDREEHKLDYESDDAKKWDGGDREEHKLDFDSDNAKKWDRGDQEEHTLDFDSDDAKKLDRGNKDEYKLDFDSGDAEKSDRDNKHEDDVDLDSDWEMYELLGPKKK